MKLSAECFENAGLLCKFINNNILKEEDIQQITDDGKCYTLFYWS